MAKKKPNNNPTQQNILIIAIMAAAIIALCCIILLIRPFANNAPSGNHVEGKVTITGTAVCLPHKDTSGPQTLECAYGLKDEKGQYYALQDTDPTYKNISAIPMNTRVTVSGTLEKALDSKYATIGTIEVTGITK